jgi:hypothetical protein
MTYDYYQDYRKQYPDDIEFLTDIGTYSFPNELSAENLKDIKNILSSFDDEKMCKLISELRVWMDNNSGGQGQFNKWIKVFLEDKKFNYANHWENSFKHVLEKVAYSDYEKVEKKDLFEIFFNHTQWTQESLSYFINYMNKGFTFGITTFNSTLSICLNYITGSKDYNTYFNDEDNKELLKLLATDHKFNKAMANYYINFENNELKTLIQTSPSLVNMFDLFKENNQELSFLIPKLAKQYASSTYQDQFEAYISPTNLLNYIQEKSLTEKEFKALFFNDNLNGVISRFSPNTIALGAKEVFVALNKYFEYYDVICDKIGFEKINIQFKDKNNMPENLALLEKVYLYQKMDNKIDNELSQDKKKIKL